MRQRTRWLGMFAATLVLGCSTPTVVLEHANHGVVLIQGLQSALEQYQREIKMSAGRRLNSVAELEQTFTETDRKQAFEAFLQSKSGTKIDEDRSHASRVLLVEASDMYATLRAKAAREQQESTARLATVVKDTSIPVEKLGAAQKTLAELGAELSVEDRVALATKFLTEAKAIASAASAPPAAPQPSTPASSAPGGG